MSQSNQRIEIRGLDFRYTRKGGWIFRGLDLDLHDEVTVLKGYSGCGKSTLLCLIAGYLKMQGGRISVPPEGQLPDGRFQREHLGYVFQELNLLPNATVDRNMWISSSMAGMSRRVYEKRRDYWLLRLGIEKKLHDRPRECSGGQRQRVAIARAMVKDAPVVLLDEPTSGLDDENTALIAAMLDELRKQGKCVVVASHDHRLFGTADRIIECGELCAHDQAPVVTSNQSK
ncbi:ABC transporter ATP-binding protein [Poriferisphaera sp. WC338]|uniref:ABC transporter ATP-binding protein n=1 Tax=Poriferisphaera sp. WC338 TaxID=3425129 RepID=UPI003D8159BC